MTDFEYGPIYRRFELRLSDLDELLRVKKRADALGLVASTFNGLAAFIDAVLPQEDDAEKRVARAINVDYEALHQFRRREVNPSEMSPASLATLGRVAQLEWLTFDALLLRDLAWFAEESPLAMLRDNTADPAGVRGALREAWLRDVLDDPGNVSE